MCITSLHSLKQHCPVSLPCCGDALQANNAGAHLSAGLDEDEDVSYDPAEMGEADPVAQPPQGYHASTQCPPRPPLTRLWQPYPWPMMGARAMHTSGNA